MIRLFQASTRYAHKIILCRKKWCIWVGEDENSFLLSQYRLLEPAIVGRVKQRGLWYHFNIPFLLSHASYLDTLYKDGVACLQ